MRRFFAMLLAACILAGTLCPVAAGGLHGTTTEEVWSQYVVAKKRFQMDLFELLRGKWRQLERTALLQRDQQLAMIAMRDLKFRWLLEHDPERIVTDEGLDGLANFEWSDADTDTLRASSPLFGELESFLEHTNRELSRDPRVREGRRRMVELSSDEVYLELTRRFRARIDALDRSFSAR